MVDALPPGSSVLAATAGPDSMLTYSDHLLRMIVFELRVANWQRAGDKKAKKPKPPETPGELAAVAANETHKQSLVKRLRAKRRMMMKGTGRGS